MTDDHRPVLAPGVATDPEFAWVREMFNGDEASRTLGMTITRIERDEAEGTMTVTPGMCNGHLTAHGGFLFAFADSLFAAACNSGGQPTVAAHVSIHFISAAHAGDVIHGHAVQSRSWGRNGITDVTLIRDGEVIAEFRGTSRSLRRQG